MLGGNCQHVVRAGHAIVLSLVILLFSQAVQPQVAMAGAPNAQLDAALPAALSRAYQQLALNPPDYPIYTDTQGTWVTAGARYWSSGFWPGELWLANELSGSSSWIVEAQTWTNGVQSQDTDTTTHDVGYKIFPPFMNGYRLTGDASYTSTILTAAGSMATRYSSVVGCIKSFEASSPHTGQFPVEIDNMPTLEMLLWGARNGGQAAWRDMAISHALRTRTEFLHPNNNGTYHVVWFDPTSGAVIYRGTLQGYSDTSTWARGQAWGIYGFTMCYHETGDSRFLSTAQTLADYYLSRLPADLVPPWDFDTGQANPPKDTSSTAIVAAALFDLSRLVSDGATSQRYWNAACNMLISLCSSTYLSNGTNSQGILLHGTYNNVTDTGVDASIVWGDYYFLQAIERYRYLSSTAGRSHTSSATWQNWPLPIQRGRFRVEFDATPNGANIDGVTALSAGPASAYPNFGPMVQFNITGYIDVCNGGAYQAAASVHYSAGASYHFRMEIDTGSRTYGVYVTPSGSSQIQLASNYAFLTEQAGVTYLDNWGFICKTGSLTLSNVQVTGPVHNLTRGTSYLAIQDAINAASAGNEIVCDPGTYPENLIFGGSQITLRSTQPNDPAIVAASIVDGRQLGSVVTFSGTEGSLTVLKGLTITNGKAAVAGGGISGRGCTATIANCVVSGNTAGEPGNASITGNGGGMAACNGSISNCTISGNAVTSPHGGGGGLAYCNGNIANCQVNNNTALASEHDGGGIYRCSGTIRGCTITGNQAGWWGGGIALSSAAITGCLIAGNSSGGGGAGLSYCSGSVSDCVVASNINTGARGESGGGLFQCGGAIVGCTIVRNEAHLWPGFSGSGTGGGLQNCTGSIRNCIIQLNINDVGAAQVVSCVTPTYSCIGNGTGGGTGNITSDPMFIDPDGPDNNPATWADNDYHLQRGSPCINAGDPAYMPASGETDVDGRPRLAYGRVDIGAYEFVLTGDINADRYVNVGDLQLLVASWGTKKDDAGYNANADLNHDSYINVGDLQLFVVNWGTSF